LLDDNGCLNRDSVNVRVTDKVFLQAMNDTIICQGDPIQLKLVSDGFTYSWTNISAENAALPNPTTTASATTTYEVMAFIGGCSAKDQVRVTTVPYPSVSAGADTMICYRNMAQLTGNTDGSSVTWSPSSSLDRATATNPIARPAQTTSFI
jgi:hypothetical protein